VLNLDPAKLLVILVIALVVLGPERLPAVARQIAGLIRELNRVRDQVRDEVRSALPDVDLPKIPKIPSARSAIAGLFEENNPSRARDTKNGDGNDRAQQKADNVQRGVPGIRPPTVPQTKSYVDFTIPNDDPGMN
jgi:sec-independent protein translocase protein TatB